MYAHQLQSPPETQGVQLTALLIALQQGTLTDRHRSTTAALVTKIHTAPLGVGLEERVVSYYLHGYKQTSGVSCTGNQRGYCSRSEYQL
jgi:hypothetical protein